MTTLRPGRSQNPVPCAGAYPGFTAQAAQDEGFGLYAAIEIRANGSIETRLCTAEL